MIVEVTPAALNKAEELLRGCEASKLSVQLCGYLKHFLFMIRDLELDPTALAAHPIRRDVRFHVIEDESNLIIFYFIFSDAKNLWVLFEIKD